MTTRMFSGVMLCVVGLACVGSSRADISFTVLGVPNWYNAAGATDASADGSVIVGSIQQWGLQRPSAFRWTAGSGYQDIGVGFAPGMNAAAVSADGTTIVGTVNADQGYSFARPYYWREGQGGMLPGLLPGGTYGWARGVSGDGTTMIGYGDSTEGYRAWKWSASEGYTILTMPAGYSMGWVGTHGISTSGNVIAGYVGNGSGTTTVRWTPSGVEVCPVASSPNAMSRDGRQILCAGPNNNAIRWWDDGHIDDLGSMPGAIVTWPASTSDDGSVVTGTAIIAAYTGRAWMWTAPTGLVNLNTWLPQQGVDLTGWVLVNVTSISPDGRTLIGWGNHTYSASFTRNETFILTIPAPSTVFLFAGGIALAARRRRELTGVSEIQRGSGLA